MANVSQEIHNNSEPFRVPFDALTQLDPYIHNLPRLYCFLISAVLVTILLLGIVGNSLVIYVIVSKRKMRHVWNFLLLNLAAADIVFMLTCGTFITLHYVQRGVWPFGDMLCRVMHYAMYVTCFVSVYSLVVVSAVRYYIIIRGTMNSVINSTRNIVVFILALWTLFLVLLIPIPLTHGQQQSPYQNNTGNYTEQCGVMMDIHDKNGKVLYTMFFVFAYVIPLTAITVTYIMLAAHIRMHPLPNTPKHKDKRSRHVTRVVVTVIVVFAICWLPQHIRFLMVSYGRTLGSEAFTIVKVLGVTMMFLNSAINPLLYNCLSAEFRDSFREVLCRRKTKGARGSVRSLMTSSSTAGETTVNIN